MGMRGIQVADGLHITRETATSDDHSSAMNPLGAVVETDDGRAYRYIKFAEASAAGQILTPLLAIDNADVDAAASDNTLTGTGDFTANEFDDGASFVTIDANTGIGQTRRITGNTANVLTLESAWTTALDATSDYQVFSPFEMELADAANEAISGVALSSMTANYYGWAQIKGLAFVRAVGSTDPWVAYEPVVSSTTAGAAKGYTNGGTTADEAGQSFGMACVAVAAGDSAGQLYPCILRNIVGA